MTARLFKECRDEPRRMSNDYWSSRQVLRSLLALTDCESRSRRCRGLAFSMESCSLRLRLRRWMSSRKLSVQRSARMVDGSPRVWVARIRHCECGQRRDRALVSRWTQGISLMGRKNQRSVATRDGLRVSSEATRYCFGRPLRGPSSGPGHCQERDARSHSPRKGPGSWSRPMAKQRYGTQRQA